MRLPPIETASDLHGSAAGIAELLTRTPDDPEQWLEIVSERFVEGDGLCTAHPFLVASLVNLLQRGMSEEDTKEALGVLNWLSYLADAFVFSPTTGRVGPGPVGAGTIQSQIKSEIVRMLPKLQELFARYRGQGEAASSLAAIAARAGKRLHQDEELRAELLNVRSAPQSHNLAVVVAKTVSIDELWVSWFGKVLGDLTRRPAVSDEEATLGLIAWCMLIQAGVDVDVSESDRIGELTARSNIDTPTLWGLFDGKTATMAKAHYLKHCVDPHSSLHTASELLAACFDPFLQIVSCSSYQGELLFQLSTRPPSIDLCGLNQEQHDVLAAVALAPAVYGRKTNLWHLWGLPGSREGLQALLKATEH
jgi:hypothetical protein